MILVLLLNRSGACMAASAVAVSEGPVAAEPQKSELPDRMPAARWQQPGLTVEVELAVDPSVGAQPFAALAHYAIGVVAVPVMLVQPQVAAGLPVYLLVAAPWQALFNARVDTLAQALVAEPLPDAVVAALRMQWRAPPSRALGIRMRLAGYGLMAKSGRKLEAFDAAEDLCLVAEGRLEVSRDGVPAMAEDLSIGPRSTTRDAPPPLCAPMSRWTADGGLMLRQATREVAEVLAALIVDRAERLL
ncbi:MAG TPA: hypothetical protein VLE45_08705 [Burkholderiaceae bacterium]|nr:hypothetical protein [Burkholderiaceae bacterium]